MSKNEELLESAFNVNGIAFEKQVPIPLSDYPWKTSQSRSNPKCDFFIPSLNLYVEVKGFMTMEAMSKMAFISKQKIKYYIFQCTEYEWNPFIKNYNLVIHETDIEEFSKSKRLRYNIEAQIYELCKSELSFFDDISITTNLRLMDFMNIKTVQFKSWNSEWIQK